MKNTWNNSKIDYILNSLKEHKEQGYVVLIMGSVPARGENDKQEKRESYQIRKLYWKDIIIIEQMIRDPDPDCSDILTSVAFKKTRSPTFWDLEVNFDGDEPKQVKDNDNDIEDFWGNYCNGCRD